MNNKKFSTFRHYFVKRGVKFSSHWINQVDDLTVDLLNNENWKNVGMRYHNSNVKVGIPISKRRGGLHPISKLKIEIKQNLFELG